MLAHRRVLRMIDAASGVWTGPFSKNVKPWGVYGGLRAGSAEQNPKRLVGIGWRRGAKLPLP